MGTIRYILATAETIYCSDKEYRISLTSEILNATASIHLHLDIDPVFFLGIPGSKIIGVRVNGRKVWEGESLDTVDLDLDKSLFIIGKNSIYVELFYQYPACYAGAVGNISGYIDFTGSYPSKVVEAEKPPQPCKILGILDIGAVDPKICGMINSAIILGGLLVGGLIVVKLLLK